MQQERLTPSPTHLLQPPTYVTPVDTSARLGSDSSAIIDVIVEIRPVDDSVHVVAKSDHTMKRYNLKIRALMTAEVGQHLHYPLIQWNRTGVAVLTIVIKSNHTYYILAVVRLY